MFYILDINIKYVFCNIYVYIYLYTLKITLTTKERGSSYSSKVLTAALRKSQWESF